MPTRRPRVLVAAVLLAAVPSTAHAAAATGGGAAFPRIAGDNGGVGYGSTLEGVSRPQATRFAVSPRTVTAGGRLPAIVLRIDRGGSSKLTARIVLSPQHGTGGRAVVIPLGTIRRGRTLHPRWPKGVRLRAGRYVARVHATDVGGQPLARPRSAPGRATVTVRARPKPKPAPKPAPTVPKPSPPASQLPGGVFPVQGTWSFGEGIGTPREGHTHQGVDVVAAQGTPVVAPTALTVRYTDYQAHGAGEYVVARLADGRDIFLAHCVRHSTVVAPGQTVAAGGRLCLVGATGDASGPHLHFELWPDGWRDVKGTTFADPLPQLKAWAR